jgi:hypothetical protein
MDILDFKGTCFSRLFPFLLVLKKVELVFDLLSIPDSSDELVAQDQTNSLADDVTSRLVDRNDRPLEQSAFLRPVELYPGSEFLHFLR